jgi:hypothetical protein
MASPPPRSRVSPLETAQASTTSECALWAVRSITAHAQPAHCTARERLGERGYRRQRGAPQCMRGLCRAVCRKTNVEDRQRGTLPPARDKAVYRAYRARPCSTAAACSRTRTRRSTILPPTHGRTPRPWTSALTLPTTPTLWTPRAALRRSFGYSAKGPARCVAFVCYICCLHTSPAQMPSACMV